MCVHDCSICAIDMAKCTIDLGNDRKMSSHTESEK